MIKLEEIDYIKNFSKISISSICKELKIDRSNLLKGKTTKANTELVKNTLIKKLKKYIKEGEEIEGN